jgi:hypothetical protein
MLARLRRKKQQNKKKIQNKAVSILVIVIQLNSLLFTCRVNSSKANYRHSTVWIQVITSWTNTM